MPEGKKDRGGIDRRTFLQGAGVAALAAGTGLVAVDSAGAAITNATPRVARREYKKRRRAALTYRVQSARLALSRNSPLLVPTNNGEERDYPFFASYSKALPHDALGHPIASAYQGLLDAVASGDPILFESIPLGGARKLTNPQAGLAFDLEGPDSHALIVRPAPRIDGAESSAEMAELYWMALARDVPFETWGSDPTIGLACTDLSAFSAFRGPKIGGQVTPATVFRGSTVGDLAGPFVSQFLLRDVRLGSLVVSQRQQTVLPGIDYMTDFASWLAVQNGGPGAAPDALDPTPRWIRSLRDLGRYVQVDALYQAYLNACLILLELGAPLDPGLPPTTSTTQVGFAEFGGPHVLSLVTEVARRALKAAWCQKWLVHRRLRPEEFGGRIHNLLSGAATYAINSEILASTALARIFTAHGTFLLPQQFPDGCPTHPAYTGGHATVAGACVTVLKAFFDDSFVLPNPVVASADGTALVPYTGSLLARDELNKLAANIATARNAAGIHWRSDFTEGLLLGELVAIGLLEEQKGCYNQDVTMTFRRFDGTTITI